MIDIETELYSEISAKVREVFPEIYMTGEYVKSPPSFPCVSLVEMDNATFRDTQTTSNENHAVVMYEVNVYSNKTKAKKTECKKIAAFIDDLLLRMNFTRTMLEPIPNQDEATIYRMLGRYRAAISKEKTIYIV